MERVLLGLKEASASYGLAVVTLRLMIRRWQLPVVKCGRRVLIRKAILDWRSEAGDLGQPAPQESVFQKVAMETPISLDKS